MARLYRLKDEGVKRRWIHRKQLLLESDDIDTLKEVADKKIKTNHDYSWRADWVVYKNIIFRSYGYRFYYAGKYVIEIESKTD